MASSTQLLQVAIYLDGARSHSRLDSATYSLTSLSPSEVLAPEKDLAIPSKTAPTSLYAACKVLKLVNALRKRVRARSQVKPRLRPGKAGRKNDQANCQDFKRRAYAEIDRYLGRRTGNHRSKTSGALPRRAAGIESGVSSERSIESLLKEADDAIDVTATGYSLSQLAADDASFLKRTEHFHLHHLGVNELQQLIFHVQDLLDTQHQNPAALLSRSFLASLVKAESVSDPTKEKLNYLDNLNHLLLCLQQQLVGLFIASCLELAHHIFHCQRDKNHYSHDWFFEYPNARHPLSTTWPWAIKPSLAVLWGVCWMFNPNTVYLDAQGNIRDSRSGALILHRDQVDACRPAQSFPQQQSNTLVSSRDMTRTRQASAAAAAAAAAGQASQAQQAQQPDVKSSAHATNQQHDVTHLHGIYQAQTEDGNLTAHISGGFRQDSVSTPLPRSRHSVAEPTYITSPHSTGSVSMNNAQYYPRAADQQFQAPDSRRLSPGAFTCAAAPQATTSHLTSLPEDATYHFHPNHQNNSLGGGYSAYSIPVAAVQAWQNHASAPAHSPWPLAENSATYSLPLHRTNNQLLHHNLGLNISERTISGFQLHPHDTHISPASSHSTGYNVIDTPVQHVQYTNSISAAMSQPAVMPPMDDPIHSSNGTTEHAYPELSAAHHYNNEPPQQQPQYAEHNEPLPQQPQYAEHNDRKRSFSQMDQEMRNQQLHADQQQATDQQYLDSDGASQTSGNERKRTKTTKRQDPALNADGRYFCPVEGCDELRWDRKCEWTKHVDKHERPYSCKHADCGKLQGFTYSGGLLRHEREVHGMHGGPKGKFRCLVNDCKRSLDGKGFTRKENLNEHMRRCHKLDKDGNEIREVAIDAAAGALLDDADVAPADGCGDIDGLPAHAPGEPNGGSMEDELTRLRAESAEKDERMRNMDEEHAQTKERLRNMEMMLAQLRAQNGLAEAEAANGA